MSSIDIELITDYLSDLSSELRKHSHDAEERKRIIQDIDKALDSYNIITQRQEAIKHRFALI